MSGLKGLDAPRGAFNRVPVERHKREAEGLVAGYPADRLRGLGRPVDNAAVDRAGPPTVGERVLDAVHGRPDAHLDPGLRPDRAPQCAAVISPARSFAPRESPEPPEETALGAAHKEEPTVALDEPEDDGGERRSTGSLPRRQLLLDPLRACDACLFEGTHGTIRGPRRANRGPEFHERLIELPGAVRRDELRRELDELSFPAS